MSLINYNTGTPTENGVYACRVLIEPIRLGLIKDEFIFWSSTHWNTLDISDLRRDQTYRGTVVGWVGPLQRRMP